MGFFAKSRPNAQRILSKGKGGSNKILMSQSLQLRNSSSNDSNSYDDEDIATPPAIHGINGIMTNGESKKGKKKTKKVWRVLQDNSMEPNNNMYMPPGTTPIDPFAITSTTLSTNTKLYNQNGLSSTKHVASTTGNLSTKPIFTTKKQFHRLDSTDDSSYENSRHHNHHEELDKTKKQASEPLLSSSTAASLSKQRATKSSITRLGKSSSSSLKKNKNILNKHIKSSSAFSKLYGYDDTTPRSSSTISEAIYYPPPTLNTVRTTQTVEIGNQDSAQPHDDDHYPSKDFIMNVIRNSNSTGEEIFDVQSESTGSGNVRTQRTTTTSNDNGGRTFQRCHSSIASESDVCSQSVQDSTFDSDTGHPIAVTNPSIHPFQQMIFDEKFQKITALTKSEAGSTTYIDLAKAATQLTKVLSPEPKFSLVPQPRASSAAPPPPHVAHPTASGIGAKQSMNKSVAKLNMLSTQSSKMKHNVQGDNMMSSNGSVDGMSHTSNHSGCSKSRGEYQAAIRAKARSPSKRNNVQRAAAVTGVQSKITSTSTPISVANATFSNSIRVNGENRSDFSFERKGTINNGTNNDPFMMASDFNVTTFNATKEDIDDYDDPFQIGNDVVGSGSNDSAWNVATNPFPYLGSSSTNGDSQPSKIDEQREVNHQQCKFTNEVGKANSMDDALMESTRTASHLNSINLHHHQSHIDASQQEVRISHSDGDLDYATSQHRVVGEYYHSGSNHQHQIKKKTTTKSVPANAIIGSMLFRQTQTCDEYCNENELTKNTKKNSTPSTSIKDKLKKATKAGGELEDQRDETESYTSNYKVPRNVHADSKSDVASSVTEEASSFYTKNLMQHNNKWNQPAQNILNHYNVHRNHQVQQVQQVQRQQQQQQQQQRTFGGGSSGDMNPSMRR